MNNNTFDDTSILTNNQQGLATAIRFQWSEVLWLSNDTLPPMASDFLTIIDLQNKEIGAVVDLIAVVFECRPEQIITSKTGRVTKKKLITLIDEAYKMVTLTLWSPHTEKLDTYEGKAVIFQNLSLREYSNKLYLESSVNAVIVTDGTETAVERLNNKLF